MSRFRLEAHWPPQSFRCLSGLVSRPGITPQTCRDSVLDIPDCVDAMRIFTVYASRICKPPAHPGGCRPVTVRAIAILDDTAPRRSSHPPVERTNPRRASTPTEAARIPADRPTSRRGPVPGPGRPADDRPPRPGQEAVGPDSGQGARPVRAVANDGAGERQEPTRGRGNRRLVAPKCMTEYNLACSIPNPRIILYLHGLMSAFCGTRRPKAPSLAKSGIYARAGPPPPPPPPPPSLYMMRQVCKNGFVPADRSGRFSA